MSKCIPGYCQYCPHCFNTNNNNDNDDIKEVVNPEEIHYCRRCDEPTDKALLKTIHFRSPNPAKNFSYEMCLQCAKRYYDYLNDDGTVYTSRDGFVKSFK